MELLRDLVLLPIALVVVVLEDVIWEGLRALLRGLDRLAWVRRADAWLRALPGWAALPIFLLLEVAGRVAEVWAFVLLAAGNVAGAVTVYLLVRIVGTLAAVFVYRACEAALLRYRWFAWVIDRIHWVRHWAVDALQPWRARLRALIGQARSRLAMRFIAMRRRLAVHRFRGDR